ncbi:ribbon-helix-helix protein, CopG family [Burkholderia sp. BCC0397]|jgi:predicted transcriptional regulator|uniref:ribbon-helix-helix protein, CopG family n=1 Tax=Burkholderia sp. BCC0397 TaxID=486876 RepID=UPI00158E0668|nr:ribbon-helix-helix protein, CopG family [Burkholderia sp. BCC0397]
MNKHEVPAEPYAAERVISTRVKPETHRALRELAANKDASVAAVFKDAIRLYLAQHRTQAKA